MLKRAPGKLRAESWQRWKRKNRRLVLNYTEESYDKEDESMFSSRWCSSARADKMLISRRVMHYDDAPGFSWWSSLQASGTSHLPRLPLFTEHGAFTKQQILRACIM